MSVLRRDETCSGDVCQIHHAHEDRITKQSGKFTDCGKECLSQYAFIVDMRVHDKPYKCEICGETCTQKGSLKTHMLIHTGEKPHQCETCGKSFTKTDDLKTHMFIHARGKLHDCGVCGKLLNSQCALRLHLRVHTGEKPFKCKICTGAFTY